MTIPLHSVLSQPPGTPLDLYRQQVARFHDWTGNEFSQVTDAAKMLDYIKARLGEQAQFTQDFEQAARAAGEIK